MASLKIAIIVHLVLSTKLNFGWKDHLMVKLWVKQRSPGTKNALVIILQAMKAAKCYIDHDVYHSHIHGALIQRPCRWSCLTLAVVNEVIPVFPCSLDILYINTWESPVFPVHSHVNTYCNLQNYSESALFAKCAQTHKEFVVQRGTEPTQ